AVSAFVSRAAMDAMIAPAEIGEDLVADGAHAGGEVIDAHAIADQSGEVAAPRRAFRELADVDGEEVHGDPARNRAAPAGHDHLRRGLAPGGRRRPQVAVGIADGYDGDAARTRDGEGGAIADALALADRAHLDDAALELHRRPH